MVQATVALLPDPVMPRRVWNRSPRSNPSESWPMALGWSPAGSNDDTIRKAASPKLLTYAIATEDDGEFGHHGTSVSSPKVANPIATSSGHGSSRGAGHRLWFKRSAIRSARADHNCRSHRNACSHAFAGADSYRDACSHASG